MCGRYAYSRSRQQLVDAFDIVPDRADELPGEDFNMAPTKTAPVVLARPPRDQPDESAVRQLRMLTWGLVPSWAKDRKIGSRMINARAETVAEKPSFRRAFAKRRALVPVDGFYEWLPTGETGKSGKPLKQPYHLRPADGSILALAGIYEFWRDKDLPDGDDTAWLISYSIITTTATDDVGRVHDRMPMSVNADSWEDWLSPDVDSGQAYGLMAAPEAGSLDIYTVSKAVNNVRNNGPELIVAAAAS